jgi:hypothetical protein
MNWNRRSRIPDIGKSDGVLWLPTTATTPHRFFYQFLTTILTSLPGT